MFKRNPAEKQISLMDPYNNFPEYIKKLLHQSWAEYFYSCIFCRINEERFQVLFSRNYSRPNSPINIIVGLLILKELNQWTDEEMMGAFYFDYRVHYALGISDFEKERVCINTVSNFRSRLYQYAETHQRDLLGEEVEALTEELIKITDMDTSLARQDSFMISSNCKMMGRLELIYTVNLNMVKILSKNVPSSIPASCVHYLEEHDKNAYIYRAKKEEAPDKIEQLLAESLELYEAVPKNLRGEQAFLNLARLLEEQTETKDGETTPVENGDIPADSMQNPSEPDATYRRKNNQANVGYVMNAVEARDEEKDLSMIVHHVLGPNVTSDVELGLNALESGLREKGVEAMVSDGAYYSSEVIKKGEKEGIEVSFSAINGRKPPDDQLGANAFTIEDHRITGCPGGAVPLESEYDEEKELFKARFDHKDCDACEHRDDCIFKEQRKSNLVSFTKKKLITDTQRSLLGTEEHRRLGDFRAGVEGVPSVFRRVYHVDSIPVRGLIRSRVWHHFKVMAYNFKSCLGYLKKAGAASPLFSFITRFLSAGCRWGTNSISVKWCYAG